MTRRIAPAGQFAQWLKQKFPQYASVPDEKLIQSFLKSNPACSAEYDGNTLVSVSWEQSPPTEAENSVTPGTENQRNVSTLRVPPAKTASPTAVVQASTATESDFGRQVPSPPPSESVMVTRCISCGTELSQPTKFCSECGASQLHVPKSQTDVPAEMSEAASVTAAGSLTGQQPEHLRSQSSEAQPRRHESTQPRSQYSSQNSTATPFSTIVPPRSPRPFYVITFAVVALVAALGFVWQSRRATPTSRTQSETTALPQPSGPTQEQVEEENRRKELAEAAQRKASQEGAAFRAIKTNIAAKYSVQLQKGSGRKFGVNQMAAMEWLQQVLNKVPKEDLVDLISMYKAMEGFDGSTTAEALLKCQRSFVGKFYVLQGDVFQIQATRDYPRIGENEFMLFGNVNLPPFIPVNVSATSKEKVPPYRIAPMLARIVGFGKGETRGGKTIIVPEVEIIIVVSGSSFTTDVSDVIVNDPILVAKWMGLSVQDSVFKYVKFPDGFLVGELCSKPTAFQEKQFCYAANWKPWIKELKRQLAGGNLTQLEADSGTQTPGNLVVTWDSQQRVVFSGFRPHAGDDASAYFVVSPQTKELDIIWRSEKGVTYLGPHASFLRAQGFNEWLDSIPNE